MSRVGLGLGSGLLCGDLLYGIGSSSVSDYGEVFDVELGVSLNVLDVLSRLNWGGSVVLHVLREGGEVLDLDFVYDELSGNALGALRVVDSVLDASMLSVEVLSVKGVTLKPLRLNDVMHYKMTGYMGDQHAHKFRIMVSNIDSHSPAYHAKSIRPGDILSTFNKEPIPQDWNSFAQMVAQHAVDQPLHLTTESSKIIIL